VVSIQAGHAIVEAMPNGMFGDAIERSTDQVPEGMCWFSVKWKASALR
jgi:hypothetical protein